MRISADRAGLAILGDLPWGSHFCQFFQTARDLLDVLVPYFQVGLENREYCLWIVHAPLSAEGARRAFSKRVPDAEQVTGDQRSHRRESPRQPHAQAGPGSISPEGGSRFT